MLRQEPIHCSDVLGHTTPMLAHNEDADDFVYEYGLTYFVQTPSWTAFCYAGQLCGNAFFRKRVWRRAVVEPARPARECAQVRGRSDKLCAARDDVGSLAARRRRRARIDVALFERVQRQLHVERGNVQRRSRLCATVGDASDDDDRPLERVLVPQRDDAAERSVQ